MTESPSVRYTCVIEFPGRETTPADRKGPRMHTVEPPTGAVTTGNALPLIDGMPRLIQAGMGIRVSGWALANATARLGALGVVSSVGLRHIVIDEIEAGDEDAIALARTFPLQDYVDELLAYAPGGPKHGSPVPLDSPDPKKGTLPKRLSVICAYIEVMRAKRGHGGRVGINVMWKCALTALPSIYGAMLAGVDALLCGAGVPMELPDIIARIQRGEDLSYSPLHGTGTNAALAIAGDGSAELLRESEPPKLIPILSNFAFPKRIIDIWSREYGGARPFAFVLEHHEAGGHNAPPRNKVSFAEADEIDSYFDKVRDLGVPVYVAGAGDRRADFVRWTERGAYGLQVGSRFALCDESGMRRDLKDAVITRNASGEGAVQTSDRMSSTGYPFKYAPIDGTLSDPGVYAGRKRICNRGYLLQSHIETTAAGGTRETYICSAMPEKQYARLGGNPDELPGRICLCNCLISTVGLLNEHEPALVTLGAHGLDVVERATARQVIEDILTPEAVSIIENRLVEPRDAPGPS
jgi:NAD(P)H-dependent flavin oxidoreductase YrpB (nitropropane dioxygenase family)